MTVKLFHTNQQLSEIRVTTAPFQRLIVIIIIIHFLSLVVKYFDEKTPQFFLKKLQKNAKIVLTDQK